MRDVIIHPDLHKQLFPHLKGAKGLVFLAIAFSTDEQDQANLTLADIAEVTGYSAETVRQAIRGIAEIRIDGTPLISATTSVHGYHINVAPGILQDEEEVEAIPNATVRPLIRDEAMRRVFEA